MVKPNFLLIGAAKCGTTSLCRLLGEHPAIFMHPRKELNFFAFDDVHARGMEWYESRFSGAGGFGAIGEGSPSYAKRTKHPHAAARIAEHLPNVKLLYIVRHPLRRIESAWLHARRSGHRSHPSFAKSVRRVPEYVETSDYENQIAAYLDRFPIDRVHVLFFEQFQSDPRRVVQDAFRFLGVDPTFEPARPDEPANPSLGRRVETRLGRALRTVPGFASILDRPSPRWSRLRRRWIETELSARPDWDAATRAYVRDRLAQPIARFLARHGKPESYWSFDD